MLFVVVLVGLSVVLILTYDALDEAVIVLDEPGVRSEGNVILLSASEAVGNVVFYPGGLVQAEAYLVAGYRLKAAGFNVYIVKMPLNLAVLNNDAFDAIYERYESDLPWVVVGHSLGGAMIPYGNVDKMNGIVLLAAYFAEGIDFSELDIPVLSITATEDGVFDFSRYEVFKDQLPGDAVYRSIEDGNHAHFGYYGAQRGDNDSQITRSQQHDIYVDWIIDFVESRVLKEVTK